MDDKTVRRILEDMHTLETVGKLPVGSGRADTISETLATVLDEVFRFLPISVRTTDILKENVLQEVWDVLRIEDEYEG